MTKAEMELKDLRAEREQIMTRHKQLYRYSQTDEFKALPRIHQSLLQEKNAQMFAIIGTIDDLISVYELRGAK